MKQHLNTPKKTVQSEKMVDGKEKFSPKNIQKLNVAAGKLKCPETILF